MAGDSKIMVCPDDGFYFGLGAFETIAVENGVASDLDAHMERLMRALAFFSIEQNEARLRDMIETNAALIGVGMERGVVKIVVTSDNAFVTTRRNTYAHEDIMRGFSLTISNIRRNESSPFTYHKTLNYGECIMAHRDAAAAGFDDALFLNSIGNVAECAVSNIFFVKDGNVFTPSIESGILAGTMRAQVISALGARVVERQIAADEIDSFDEAFVTNSLMGIMPVNSIGEKTFASRKITEEIAHVCKAPMW